MARTKKTIKRPICNFDKAAIVDRIAEFCGKCGRTETRATVLVRFDNECATDGEHLHVVCSCGDVRATTTYEGRYTPPECSTPTLNAMQRFKLEQALKGGTFVQSSRRESTIDRDLILPRPS